MDPELLKAIREYMKVSADVQKSGATVTPENQEEFFREKTGGKYGFKDADKVITGLRGDHGNGVASFLQGFTSNFGDEVVGAMPDALGGGEAGQEQMRLRSDMFHQDHPVADAALGVGGAVASTALLPELKMGRAATTGARIARGAGVGAAYGGAAGAGSGENTDERLMKGGFGTVAGGVLGAIPGAAVATYKTLLAPLDRATARVEEAIQQMGGFHAARGEITRLRAAGKDHLGSSRGPRSPSQRRGRLLGEQFDQSALAVRRRHCGEIVGHRAAHSRRLPWSCRRRAWPDSHGGAQADSARLGG